MILVQKMERPLGRPRRRWKDNIKTDIKWVGVDWIRVVQYRDKTLTNTLMNLWVPKISGVRNDQSGVGIPTGQDILILLEESVPSYAACCTVDTRGCFLERKVSVMCD